VTARTSSELPAWYEGLTEATVVSGAPGEASAVCFDSRSAAPAALFVAMPGLTFDGNAFIPDAIGRGARFVIVQENLRDVWQPYVNEDVTFVAVPNARAALAQAAAGFYGHPARQMGVIGVTGTDGKTTTTHLTAHVLNATGQRAGYLSSVEFGLGGHVETNASHMTTLEASEVQRHLARIRDAAGRYAVVEASSIGLDMHRVDECEFDAGVFTNLAPDHLDYHGSMAAYRDAKALLFRMLGESVEKPGVAKAAILNADDSASAEIAKATQVPVITYGVDAPANLTAHDIRRDGWGMRFSARMFGQDVPGFLPLLGEYNVANALGAVAAAVSENVDFADAVAGLESFTGVPGRLELIEEGQPYRVVVDIASTEQAMRNVVRMLRAVTHGRIIVLFGAAGERDPARRRGIGRAVADGADFAVITNEDPRSEDPDLILDEIAAALKGKGWSEGRNYLRELDRRQAMELAFKQAQRGDTVLLAGKATEPSIVIANTHWPWDERRIARELLRESLDV
jgi:UDP-N-acetylmuramoyl-L-alanyl-D-glutamate--2,6-diaminopimelate ligase